MKTILSDKSIGDIAIVGMTGRFPGVRDSAAFWRNLPGGVSQKVLANQPAICENRQREERFPNGRVVHLYEPTETTVANFFYLVPEEVDVRVQSVDWPFIARRGGPAKEDYKNQ